VCPLFGQSSGQGQSLTEILEKH